MSQNEEEQKKESVTTIRYEWESELEEYDEPDCYPCERDYKMVEELVSCDEDEESTIPQKEEEAPVPPSAPGTPAPAPAPEADEKPPDDAEGEKEAGAAEGAEEGGEEKPKEGEEEKKEGEEGEKEKEKGEGEEEDEEDDEMFVPGDEGVEEEEVVEPKKKRYKTVMVRKLIERGPKIHYDINEERIKAISDDPGFFQGSPMKLVHSFGYDCQRMANLHFLDENTLVFMSGFVLTFFNMTTHEKTYHRCLSGSCFGALASHPSKKLFAAAEKGKNPVIGIWSWPKLQLFRQLLGGTEAVYASVNFSPDGKLLASQGAEPDYLITVSGGVTFWT